MVTLYELNIFVVNLHKVLNYMYLFSNLLNVYSTNFKKESDYPTVYRITNIDNRTGDLSYGGLVDDISILKEFPQQFITRSKKIF